MEKTLRTNEQKRMAINVVKDQENYLTPVPCIFYYFVQWTKIFERKVYRRILGPVYDNEK